MLYQGSFSLCVRLVGEEVATFTGIVKAERFQIHVKFHEHSRNVYKSKIV
jgi:hypothetical protein